MQTTRLTTLISLMLALVLGSIGIAGAQGGDVIVRGGTVVISEGQADPFQRIFNPYAPNPTRWTRSSIYEPLLVFNPVDGGVSTPWLATGYEYSEDLLSLVFTLREGVEWSDGEVFNADDVVFTFEMFLNFPGTDTRGTAEFLGNVEKIDAYTVKVTLSKVYTQAHAVLGGAWIVPEHAWDKEDPVTFTNPDPVGTGPLTNVANVTEQVLEICRNENYWQMGADGEPLPYIDCIRQPLYSGNDPANLAAANGELDWIGNFIANIEQTFVAANPEKHHYYFWPGGATVQLYTNTTKAPFNDVEFRRALSTTIDYEAVTGIGMYGYTVPSNAVGLGPRYDAWVSQAALDRAAEMGLSVYDPDRAEEILEAAGYVDANGDGWRDMPDGSAIKFNVQVVDGWTDWVTSVQIMTENFKDVGLNVTMQTPDYTVWFANLQTGEFDASIGWGTAGNTPWDHFRNIMDSTLIDPSGQANGQMWGRWTSPETDALISAFTKTADEIEQHAIIDQLQMAYVENVVTVPLFPGPTWYEWTTYRFTGFPTEEDYYTQGSPWQEDPGARLIVLTRLHCISEEACAAR